jgi:stigma-specific protein Stig1
MKQGFDWITKVRVALPGPARLAGGPGKHSVGPGSRPGWRAVARAAAARPSAAAGERRIDFDALAKDLAHGLSRREALRRLGLGLAAGLLAELTGWLPAWPTAQAAAATVAPSGLLCFPEIVTKGSLFSWVSFSSTIEQVNGCKPAFCYPGVCCGGKCCASNACCNNVCVPLQTDPKNCGACGTVCQSGHCCLGVCSDLSSDSNNCGGCGRACPSDEYCRNGQCVPCPIAGQHPCNGICCASTQACCPGSVNAPCCDPGLLCCGNGCADLLSDPKNCGTCGHACPSGQSCCSGACTDLASDQRNCGTCGHQCPFSSPICCAGQCAPICSDPDDTFCCGRGGCVNLQLDANNCGACGHVCPSGVCRSGVCA